MDTTPPSGVLSVHLKLCFGSTVIEESVLLRSMFVHLGRFYLSPEPYRHLL